MFASVLFLIAQIVQHGIDALRLLADAVHDVLIGRDAVGNVEVVLEVALGRETMLQPTVEDGLSHAHEFGIASLFAIFQSVEAVEQHTSAEAYLHMVYGFAVVDAQAVT